MYSIFDSGDGATMTFEEIDELLAQFQPMLGYGRLLSIVLPSAAKLAARCIMALLQELGIQVVVLRDSDPEATDYFGQTLLGGSIGAVGGAVGGVCALSVLTRLGYFIPYVGWFLVAATALGAAAGAGTGFAVTRMGLRVRFTQDDSLQLDLVPLPA